MDKRILLLPLCLFVHLTIYTSFVVSGILYYQGCEECVVWWALSLISFSMIFVLDLLGMCILTGLASARVCG